MSRLAMVSAAAGALGVGTAALGQCTPGWISGFGGTGLNGTGRAAAGTADGHVVVAGNFTVAGGTPVARIAHLNTATNVFTPLGTPTGSTSTLEAVAVLPDGDILTGGNFSNLGGTTVNRIGRFDIDTQTWSDINYGTQGGAVNAILVLPGGGQILAGGNIPRAQNRVVNHVARYTFATGQWENVGSNMVSSGDLVLDFALAPDGTVIVGGSFLSGGGGGVGALRIARYNPSNNAWSALGSGCNNVVEAVEVLDDGDVVAGGYFTSAGGVPCNRLARFDVDTGTWSALGGPPAPGFSHVTDIVKLPSGELFIGGEFTVAGGVAATRVVICNPDTDTFTSIGSAGGSEVEGLGLMTGGRVAVVGHMTGHIRGWSPGGTPPSVDAPPQDVSVCGSPAQLTVSASGTPPLAYQWRFNGAPIDTAGNPSAATDTLTLPAPEGVDSGFYDVVVSNACDSVASPAAYLAVNSADFNGDGDVGTDADIEAYFACLGGNCCAACGSADFNADGDVGTDADIESFFRVLSGGAC